MINLTKSVSKLNPSTFSIIDYCSSFSVIFFSPSFNFSNLFKILQLKLLSSVVFIFIFLFYSVNCIDFLFRTQSPKKNCSLHIKFYLFLPQIYCTIRCRLFHQKCCSPKEILVDVSHSHFVWIYDQSCRVFVPQQ